MAYRVGAEVAGGDQGFQHRGTKYFAKCGQSTWIGVFKDAYGNPVLPWYSKPSRRYAPGLLELAPKALEDYAVNGKGPLYLDTAGATDQDYKYMLFWLINEGNAALVDYMEEEGIDTRKNPIEFMRYPPLGGPGIRINTNSETSVPGLYAGGDGSRGIGAMAGAAIHGWVGGENAAKYAKDTPLSNINRIKDKINEKEKLIEDIQSRENGASWREVNIALQQIMTDYVREIRSETMLNAGLTYLRRLKEKAYKTMMAANKHELMRGLEALNLIDQGELVFIASNDRKESRDSYIRSDYPYTDPKYNGKYIVLRKENDKIVTDWAFGQRKLGW